MALSSHSRFLVSAPSISLLSSLAGPFDLFVFCFLTFVLLHFGSVCDGPLSSSSIVLGRFAAVCSRTFITAALTLLSTVFLSHLSISVASAHWSEIVASWYGKFFFFLNET